MKLLICIGIILLVLVCEILLIIVTAAFGYPVGFGYGLEIFLMVWLSIKFCRKWDSYKIAQKAFKEGMRPIDYVKNQVSKGVLQHLEGLRGNKRKLSDEIKKYIKNGYINKQYYNILFEEYSKNKIKEQTTEETVVKKEVSEPIEERTWICPMCKKRNMDSLDKCWNCGSEPKQDIEIEPPADAPISTDYTQIIEEKVSPVYSPTSKDNDEVSPIQTPQIERPKNVRFCSKCGAMIDPTTKKCTGCGKQYFRGIRFNKFLITIAISVLIIASISVFCVLQYINTQELKDEITVLEKQIGYKEQTIDRLNGQLDDLEDEKWENRKKLNFFDNHVVFVEDDGTNLYHKYGCYKFEGNYFWAYNVEAAIDRGYKECPLCH